MALIHKISSDSPSPLVFMAGGKELFVVNYNLTDNGAGFIYGFVTIKLDPDQEAPEKLSIQVIKNGQTLTFRAISVEREYNHDWEFDLLTFDLRKGPLSASERENLWGSSDGR